MFSTHSILHRSHRASLKKLRKLISDSSKHIRHRRHLINIHIAVLGWLTEVSGFFIIFLGAYILGHGNTVVTLILQSLTIFLFYNILPCIYLINDSDFKAEFAETQCYFNLLKLFKSERVDPTLLKNENKDDQETVNDNDDENK